MKHQQVFSLIVLLLFLINSLSSCDPTIVKNKDYWISFTDTITYESGYKNNIGKIVIPLEKYPVCATDTFRTYAIDRQETILYKVFSFDNGPDNPADGLFRIIENGKIGYADSLTGKVVIKPQLDCAEPFENGIAKVSNDCTTQVDGEHTIWLSDHWYFIDKTGRKVGKPNTANEK